MPKSAHFSLGNIIYILLIGSLVHFATCDSLFPCFNYFLLKHCDIMCFGLFICYKMFICNITELIISLSPEPRLDLEILKIIALLLIASQIEYIYIIVYNSQDGNTNCINISQGTMWSEIYNFLLNTLILNVYCSESLLFIMKERKIAKELMGKISPGKLRISSDCTVQYIVLWSKFLVS